MYQQNPFNKYKIYKTNTLNDKNCFTINKNVKILTFVPETNPEELNFVNKVMKTLNLDKSSIQITSLANNENCTLIENIPDGFNLFILLMGIKPNRVGFNFSPDLYTPKQFSNLTVAATSSPQRIMKSKDEKALLWNLIKTNILNEE